MSTPLINEVARKGFMNLDPANLATAVQSRGRATGDMSQQPEVDVEAITHNLLPNTHCDDGGAVRLANEIVDRGGHEAKDRSGIAVFAKSKDTGAPNQKGTGEPDGETTSYDARNKERHAAFPRKYPGETRAKAKAFAADPDNWEKGEPEERKAFEAYCDDDSNWTDKSTNAKVYGNTRQDTTTKVFG